MHRSGGGGRGKRLARVRGQGRASPAVGRQQFERLVAEALDDIPEPFASRLENVAVVVEDVPDPDLLASLGMSRRDTLLGLYDGIPLTERGDWYNFAPPDRIIIFRKPILDICSSPREIREQVRQTVVHEVAHFYGIDDDQLEEMGLS